MVFWLGISALIVSLISLFVDNVLIQMIIFVILSTLLLFLTRPFVEKFVTKKEEKTYTIEFDSLNDELILPIKVSEGEILKNIPKPLKDGYIFQGWYFLNNKFNFENPIHKNMVLVASWEKLTE